MEKTDIIETGVDKLVELIKHEKKISIKSAALKLGVSASLVEEWANFLEEEELIEINYQITTPYLIDKQLSKQQLDQKKDEFYKDKEILLKKAENTLDFLDDQGTEIKTIREEFQKFRKDIEKEVESAKKNLKELEDSLSTFKKKEKEIEAEVIEGRDATQRFEQIITKKDGIENLVKRIDEDKVELRSQVIRLIGIVKALGLSMEGKENTEHISQLQGTFSDISQKRGSIEEELKALSKMIKGMQ